MAIMQVRFSFDDNLMKKNGIERQDVYYTLKRILRKGRQHSLMQAVENSVIKLETMTKKMEDIG